MAKVIYGLNKDQYLSEVLDKTEAIKNLGIDKRDLDVIRDISADPNSLDKEDLRLISGLKSDIRAVLYSLRSSVSFFPSILANAPVSNFPINNNISINAQLSARSFKYNYYDFSAGTTKTADISTSRNSSWSSFEPLETAPIYYSGDVEIIPTPATAKSTLTASDLAFNLTPEPLIFAAQEPTHLIKLTINGVEQSFYAMKGIPLVFDGFFRTATFDYTITRNATQKKASITLEFLDTNEITTWEDQNSNSASINMPDFKARPKRIKFYSNPARITRLNLPKMMIAEWPNVKMPTLSTVDISINDFREMPNFAELAPSLQTLNIFGNDLTRGQEKTANAQLAKLPLSIRSLNINGCFEDNTPIDLSSYTNLRTLNFNSYYTVSSNNTVPGKRMTDVGSTPQVSPNNLTVYNVTNQRYTKLHTSVSQATKLETINIGNNNILTNSDGGEITLDSTELKNFYSNNNSHNIVDVNGKQKLVNYEHTYGYTLTGNKVLGITFQGCQSLERIVLYSTYVEGDIAESFASLPKLKYLDIRLTRLHGKLTKNSFSGSPSLNTILIQGSRLGYTNTTGNTTHPTFADIDTFEQLTSLTSIFIVGNRGIKGAIPNFSLNKQLTSINIQSTDFSSGLQSYNSLPMLQTLIVRDCKLSQGVPAFDSTSLETIRLEFNNLTSSATNPIPDFKCSRLKYLSINNNLLGGPMPSFSNCLSLETLIMSNNKSLVGYKEGSIELCTKLKTVDFSNCGLTVQDIQTILSDLRKNYDKNKRTGVRINLLGNNYKSTDIINNSLSLANLNYLRTQGWSITI